MSYDRDPDYERMLEHTSRHKIKEWLLRGAEREDAQTIRHALKKQSPRRLARKLAAILTEDQDG
jgi:hypothetical protein